jgi:hypothetical protein
MDHIPKTLSHEEVIEEFASKNVGEMSPKKSESNY